MKHVTSPAVLAAIVLTASACGGGHDGASRPSATALVDNTAARPETGTGVSSGTRLSRLLREEIAALVRAGRSQADQASVTRVEVYGPASRLALVRASSGSWVSESPDERNARFYLIVLYGKFVCGSCSVPRGAGAPRGTVETHVWSPAVGGTDFGLGDRLPAPVSRLPRLAVIRVA
jgi:hypothetical protein